MAENVIFMKSEVDDGLIEENDEWDDSLLVKAYDKAVSLAKEKIAAKLAAEKDGGSCEVIIDGRQNTSPLAKTSSPKRSKWKVGNLCRAPYSVDGKEYEAVIKSIDTEEGMVTVKYLGYGNEEEVHIQSLRPSLGKEAQLQQKIEAKSDLNREYENYGLPNGYRGPPSNFQQNSGVIPPPPPPFVMANLPKDETDALSAMLMSWYMSGYHTGYYQGLTRSKMFHRHYQNGN